MDNENCGVRYCKAITFDNSEIVNDIECECLKCLGKNCSKCNTYIMSAQLQINLQRLKCIKCKYYNGK